MNEHLTQARQQAEEGRLEAAITLLSDMLSAEPGLDTTTRAQAFGTARLIARR